MSGTVARSGEQPLSDPWLEAEMQLVCGHLGHRHLDMLPKVTAGSQFLGKILVASRCRCSCLNLALVMSRSSWLGGAWVTVNQVLSLAPQRATP